MRDWIGVGVLVVVQLVVLVMYIRFGNRKK